MPGVTGSFDLIDSKGVDRVYNYVNGILTGSTVKTSTPATTQSGATSTSGVLDQTATATANAASAAVTAIAPWLKILLLVVVAYFAWKLVKKFLKK